jgi:hypothetical protein
MDLRSNVVQQDEQIASPNCDALSTEDRLVLRYKMQSRKVNKVARSRSVHVLAVLKANPQFHLEEQRSSPISQLPNFTTHACNFFDGEFEP